jgi:hypothetical protein
VIYSCRKEEDLLTKSKMLSRCVICLLVLLIPLSRGLPGIPLVVRTGQGTAAKPARTIGQLETPATTTAKVTPSPTPGPTPSAGPARGQPPLSLTFMLIFTGCSVGLVIGVIVVGAIISMRRQHEKKERIR